jgi:ABC-2 type transport system ATP-binding protein
MSILNVLSVTKRYGTTVAVDQVSLAVTEGEIYGFLGLNGAGKTTMIRMLLGMIGPDRGSVALFGRPVGRLFDAWNEVGYLVETPYAYPNLSVSENLDVFYRLRRLDRPAAVETIIQQLRLDVYRDTPARHLSLGNRQRLGLAKALLHRPRLLILDEPTNGLDPAGIVEVRALLAGWAAAGATVFLSSHILGEIAKLATRIGIIHRGRLVRELQVKDLSGQLIKKVLADTADNGRALEILRAEGHPAELSGEGILEINGERAIARPEILTSLLTAHGLPPRQLFTDTEDMEHFFLRVIREEHATP